MLTAADLAELRAVQAADLPDTCVVTRRADSADGAGGQTEAAPSTVGTFDCRKGSIGRSDQEALLTIDERRRASARWAFTFEHGAYASRPEDTITHNGEAHHVVGDNTGISFATALRVYAGTR